MKSEFSQLLACRPFTRFLLARMSGLTAHQMLMVVLAWHMYELTHSAWDLGLVGLCQFVPALLATLPAGQVVDRMNRAHVFAVSMLAEAVVAGVMALSMLTGSDQPALILAMSVVLGVARAFQMPAQQALTPLLVPPSLLTRAVALSSSSMQVGIIGGPALGGVLYGLGAAQVYAICAALLLLSAGLTALVRLTHRPPARHKGPALRTLLAGLAFVWQRKVLMGSVSLDMFAVLLGGATALLPIYASDILHTGPEGLGALRAAPAVGALLMSLALTRWPLERHVGRTLLWAVACFGLATVVFGLSHSFWLSMVALMVTGAADSISVVVRMTVMQMETPDDMRGRVAAVNSIFIGASNQLGEFESGAVAALWGAPFSVISGGVGTMLVALLWGLLFPALARRDRMNGQAHRH